VLPGVLRLLVPEANGFRIPPLLDCEADSVTGINRSGGAAILKQS